MTSKPLQLLYSDDSSCTRSQTGEIDPCLLYVAKDEAHRLIFEERLVLEDEQGLRLDEVTIAVEADADSDEGKLLVYQYSQDESRLLRVQSRVYRSLRTDTELRRIQRSDHTRTLRVTDTSSSYRVFVLSITGKEGWRDKVEYDKSASDLIILEGCNIVLLRKLAIDRLFGHFRGQTINHEGELCECTYTVERGDGGDVVVRRVVTSSTGQEIMTTLLSRAGYIRSHHWSSSDWHLVGGELRTWTESDLSSKGDQTSTELEVEDADTVAYFEKKEELILMMKAYYLGQPDVQDMIADFLKNLLFDKPRDVIDFADKFFSEFVGIDWSSEESDDSFFYETFHSVSDNKSTHTEEFNLDYAGNHGRSLGSFIKTDILNAIINQI